jgi:predicted acetylornithine/succinylornithine family transaminase
MGTKQIIEEAAAYLMDTYYRLPVVLRKGRGVKVWGADGKEYLDFVGGVAANVLGHCHPKVVVALQKQAQRLLHVSNYYHIEPQARLARVLVENSFADKAFFCNSGAEANEAAIKLARKYARENRGEDKYEIITALSSFHGRTMGALSATGQEKFHKGFEPMLKGFIHVPFNDAVGIRNALSPRTCAVMLEPLQGESGVRVPDPGYLEKVRRMCDDHGVLLILDEVQTGMGRTGTLFAHEQYGITPDIMTLAKGLGGGVPIGAMLATAEVAGAFRPGDHGTTFGGNPLVCAAALATLETLLDGRYILDQCRRMGAYLKEKLLYLKDEFPSVVIEVRGAGLLLGMEISKECGPVVNACLEKGLLINCAAGNVLRFMPPLIVREKEIDRMSAVLQEVLDRV